MGIVVTITMLLGLIMLRSTPWRNDSHIEQPHGMVVVTVISSLVIGLWNVFWYGMRHFGEFWGMAAIVSGVVMLLAAVIIVLERGQKFPIWFKGVRHCVVAILALSFLLYSITIVQLNLSLPIIGR